MKIKVREATIDEAQKVHMEIDGFYKNYLTNKLKEIDLNSMVIFIASVENRDIGYSISYDRWNDGSLYAWMAGVIKEYRKHGCYKKLAKARMDYAKKKGYTSLKLKTKNKRREMLNFLVNDGWLVFDFIKKEDPLESNILFEKAIMDIGVG